MLYLIATPIGNLGDITARAVEILRTADYILCEDTRHSGKLMHHLGIDTPLKSYHLFNEAKKLRPVLDDLQGGKQICLISDAGTPSIADPGELLVRSCHDAGIAVAPLPGPCAVAAALSASGLPTHPFTFWGFLPKKERALKERLITFYLSMHTSVCYVPPHQLLKLLGLAAAMMPTREATIARELTKKHEQLQKAPLLELLEYWKDRPIKGEIVFMVAGSLSAQEQAWAASDPRALVKQLETQFGITKKEALQLAAKLSGIPKRTLYELDAKKSSSTI